MRLIPLFGILFFALGNQFDNFWLFLLAVIFLSLAVIPLLIENTFVVLLISILSAEVRWYFFGSSPWYLHVSWVMLILIISVPLYRTFFIKN